MKTTMVRHGARSFVLALVFGLFVMLAPMATPGIQAAPLSAPPSGTPFTCNGIPYFLFGNVIKSSPVNDFNNLTTVATLPAGTYNGLAYNRADNYLYVFNATTNVLYRVFSDGTYFAYNSITGLSSFNGVFDGTNAFVSVNGGTARRFNVNTDPPTLLSTVAGASVAPDDGYNPGDGYIYYVGAEGGANGNITRYDPITGIGTTVATLNGATTTGYAWGVFFTSANTMVWSNNGTAWYSTNTNTGATVFLQNTAQSFDADACAAFYNTTTQTLSGSSGYFSASQSFTFTDTVNAGTGSNPAVTPTGTVTFMDNGSNIPTCVNMPLASQIATCTVTLGIGKHVISANYNGDTNFGASTASTTLTLMIATCTSQATGNWNTIATWDCGHVPTTGDSVNIGSGKTITLDVDTADLKDVTLGGGTLTTNSVAHTIQLTGNWSNSGTFSAGTFIGVTFDGTGTQTLTGNTAFYNLTVNSGSTLDVGSVVVTVNGTATNAGTIKRLAPAQTITLNADYTFNDGVGKPTAIINQSGGTAMGNTTVQANAHTTTAHACNATTLGGTPVKRYYNITPTNGANVTADVTLYFFDDSGANSEANGNTLANIAVYHCEGGTWVRLSGGTYSTGTSGNYNWVKLAGHTYTSFSPFAISGVGTPTAVTLSSFEAKPGFDLGTWFRQILGR